MSFSFTPQQQPQQSLFQSPFQQSTPFQPQQQQLQQQQQQQSPFQLQLQQPQPQPQPQQPQPQPQPQLYLFTNDKTPATYSTKWADLHPDSQKVLLQIEERILEYRDESQRLDQCSRLYDSSVSNNGFELDASYIVQELGGISIAMERQKATLQELMTVVKDMLRNTEVAVRSFMILRPRFLHQNKTGAASATAPSQPSGATTTQTSGSQPEANSMVPIIDFYSGLPKKPSPFLHQTVARFEKYLSQCRQWIEELEQLLLLDSERNSSNPSSSLLQSLPKVMANVHDFFVHVAAKVESIHQYLESMKTAYLADQRRRGDGNDPFLEADRRETAKQEAAARRVHPTLHLPAASQSTGQGTGPFAISAAPGASTAARTAATPQSSPFSSLSASTSAFGISTPLFSSTLLLEFQPFQHLLVQELQQDQEQALGLSQCILKRISVLAVYNNLYILLGVDLVLVDLLNNIWPCNKRISEFSSNASEIVGSVSGHER
ncbi:Nuclear pore complex protein [Sesamum angolense]|uniref:Nuclear pore complex protein n=1 Tax=Sesamum angolense TaxID=2727404 RepID=A0AAE1WHE6_9LAMI|nr:Nuclear pore complex protein [Sesamum angolense]